VCVIQDQTLNKKKEKIMIKKKILVPQRVRRTGKSFCFIPHRFLTDGFLQSLSQHELSVYLFLVLASDKNGISFYADKTIQSILGLKEKDYIFARSCLLHKDLIDYNGILFQVLSLPDPRRCSKC
jgi:hypothetical protein